MEDKTAAINGLVVNSMREILKDKLLGTYLCSDLSLGAWKGHFIAYELSKQLGLNLVEDVQPQVDTVAAWMNKGYSETVGKLIDTECIGDMNIYAARKYALHISNAINKDPNIKIYIILPKFKDLPWGIENFHLIQNLKLLLEPETLYLVTLNQSNKNIPLKLPIKWELEKKSKIENTSNSTILVSLPGILETTFLEKSKDKENIICGTDYWLLPNGFVLIDPAIRKLPQKGKILPYVISSDFKYMWMKAYWLVFSELEDKEEFIRSESGIRFSEGAFESALYLLQKVKKSSNNEIVKASISAQIQGIRIALLDFRSASQEPKPSSNIPVELQAVLYQSIAWGMVMTGQAKKAEVYFQIARTNLKGKAALRDYLYLLNISALTKLKNGKIDEAFAFEKEIEFQLSIMKDKDWHLIYINSINQARLYKLIRSYEVSYHYYQLAFSTNEGLRQTSDLIYQNVCVAQLLSAKNDSKKILFIHWFRVALFWLAEEVPEALAPRVVQAITKVYGKKLDDTVESVSEAIVDHLQGLIGDLNLFAIVEDDESIPFIPNFHFSEALEKSKQRSQRKYLIGNNGWSVIVSRKSEKSISPTSIVYHNLARLVTKIIQVMCPNMIPEVDFSIYVDHRQGRDIPATKSEILLCCERLAIPKAFFGANEYSFNSALLEEISYQKEICHAKAVKSIQHTDNGTLVSFKRFKSPVLLKGTKSKIMILAKSKISLTDIKNILSDTEQVDLNSVLTEMERSSFIESKLLSKAISKME